MRFLLTALVVANLLLSAKSRGADIATHPSLTLDGAKKVAEAAAAFAKANGAAGNIAVVDEGGHLLYFLRLDGSFPAGASVSIGKARTAATFKKPTKDFEDTINRGRIAMTSLPPDFTPLQGGVPIKHHDQIVGAIGVSGAKSAMQDEEVAYAGAHAIEETTTAQQ